MGSLFGAEVYYQKFIELQEKLRKRFVVFHTHGYVYVCIVQHACFYDMPLRCVSAGDEVDLALLAPSKKSSK